MNKITKIIILLTICFHESVYSQNCLQKKTFKVKSAFFLLEDSKGELPYLVDITSSDTSFDIKIYPPGEMQKTIIIITNIDSTTSSTNGDFKCHLKGIVKNEENHPAEIIFSKKEKIFQLQIMEKGFSKKNLLFTMIEKKQKNDKTKN
jgi:hypothetical protein